jgi:hypothetical protein
MYNSINFLVEPFSIGGDFVPQETFGNVWKCFWLLQLNVMEYFKGLMYFLSWLYDQETLRHLSDMCVYVCVLIFIHYIFMWVSNMNKRERGPLLPHELCS